MQMEFTHDKITLIWKYPNLSCSSWSSLIESETSQFISTKTSQFIVEDFLRERITQFPKGKRQRLITLTMQCTILGGSDGVVCSSKRKEWMTRSYDYSMYILARNTKEWLVGKGTKIVTLQQLTKCGISKAKDETKTWLEHDHTLIRD